MRKKIRWWSIRTKIFIIFVFFILFTSFLVGMNNYFHNEKEKQNKKLSRLIEFEKNANKAVYYQNLVFLKDFSSTAYYENNKSFNTDSYFLHYSQARKLLKKIKAGGFNQNDTLKSQYKNVKDELRKIDFYFRKIVALQRTRGFRDAGIEGRMRTYAHWMEKSVRTDQQKSSLLQLRRHEKDYFLRGDTIYAEKLRLESNIFAGFTAQIPGFKKNLEGYLAAFDSIKVIDNLTGLRTNIGYNNLLSMYTAQLNQSVSELYKAYKTHHETALAKIDSLRMFAFVVLISIGLLISMIIAWSITIRIRKLSDFMNKYVESGFRVRSRFIPDNSKDEIADLYKNFLVLEDEITVQFEKYKLKVGKRTEEILRQKSEIEKQNALINEKNTELTKQKNVLDFQNHHILDSLKAGKELQKAFYPRTEKLASLLGNFHLRFDPLDIVSGDFYWVEQTENGLYIAIADCTGHGAHGALMSINGINLLNQAIKDKELVHPYEILNYLSEKIHQQFKHEDFQKHSIDIAMIRLYDNQLYFAGAQRSIVLISGGEVIELTGDRRPLGWFSKNELYNFTGQTISVKAADTVVMYTDGITDQFGGPDRSQGGKKFMKSHFTGLIKESVGFKPKELFELLSESYDNWKMDADQTDDVTLLVFDLSGIVDRYGLTKGMQQVKHHGKREVA